MLEFFSHLFSKDVIEWLFAQYGTYIYLVLFLIIFVETGVVAMPFLPGDSLLFLAGLYAHKMNEATSEPYLNIFYLLGLLISAAVLGDNSNYWIGRTLGLKVMHLKIRNKNIVKQEYLDKTHSFYEKYGTKTIILARFVPIVRTFAPFVAGIAKMTYYRFLSYDILGGMLWISSMTIAGYFLGQFEIIRNNIEKVAIGIVFISILPIIIEYFKHRAQKAKA